MTDMDPRRARMSLVWFGAVVVVVTAALQIAMARTGLPIGKLPFHVIALMWTPGLAAIAVRLARREGFADVSFRGGGRRAWRAIAIVIAYPTVVGAIAYGIAWTTGLARFHAPESTFHIRPSNDALRFLLRYAVAILPGTPLSLITALGEEIGWRGFFVPRLVQAGAPRPLLISGVVWGLWHMPLILTGQYASGPSPVLSAALFLASIVPAAYLFGWARLATGSVWPAAVAHAAWNSIIQGVFDASTVGSTSAGATNIWIGESGVLVALTSAVVVAVFLRKPFPIVLRPVAATSATGSPAEGSTGSRRSSAAPERS